MKLFVERRVLFATHRTSLREREREREREKERKRENKRDVVSVSEEVMTGEAGESGGGGWGKGGMGRGSDSE